MDVVNENPVVDVIENALHDAAAKPWTIPFDWPKAQISVGQFKVPLGLVVVLSFYLVIGHGATVSSNAIGFGYPAYQTVTLTLRTSKQRPPSTAVVNNLFTYWMTFTTVLIVEQYCGIVLSLIPFYLLIRTTFLLWCSVATDNNGAAFINRNIIHPRFDSFYASKQRRVT